MVKKYIIMCGGEYKHWEKPRHLSVVNGEELVARTIRLLRENGIEDISISSNNPIFEQFGVPVLKHNNSYSCRWHNTEEGYWFNGFYPTEEPVCYILGDVYFSDEAIKTIVETDTDDIEMFGSAPPFADNYIKTHIEAFALKVKNQEHLREAISETIKLDKEGAFWRKPIIWELWMVIKNLPPQKKEEYIYNYTIINDYSCDIDWEEDIRKLNKILGGKENMIKVKVIEEFSLRDYAKLKNIVRAKEEKNKEGYLFVGDTFECDKEMVDYLLGGNANNKAYIEVIEVVPEKKEEPKVEEPKEEIKIVEAPKKAKTIKKSKKTKLTKKK